MSIERQLGPHGTVPVVLTIAGLDPSGGAGLVADLKTIQAHGCCGMAVATALTAQNTMGVSAIEPVDPAFVRAQLEAVFQDVEPDAVKVGMVPDAEVAEAIADALDRWEAQRIVVDPVMVSSTGTVLSDEQCATRGRGASPSFLRLYRRAALVTPNLDEAEALLGEPVRTRGQRLHAAGALAGRLDTSVLLKAGHTADDADDILARPTDDGFTARAVALPGERLPGAAAHGTGCALSSAIACGLASNMDLEESCRAAKRYVSGGLSHEPGPGRGVPPIDHLWYQDLETRLAWPWEARGLTDR